jgi:transposase
MTTSPGRSVESRTFVREAIEVTVSKPLYVRPYSSDFNPIEQLFAKLKALLLKAAARSGGALGPRARSHH